MALTDRQNNQSSNVWAVMAQPTSRREPVQSDRHCVLRAELGNKVPNAIHQNARIFFNYMITDHWVLIEARRVVLYYQKYNKIAQRAR